MNSIAYLLTFTALFVSPTFSFTQNLPDEIYFSTDGERLVSGGSASQGFYDESVIRIIEITFSQSNYWTLLQNNYASGTDLMAVVTIDGVAYDSVGVRFKGTTSYLRNNTDKKSFNITLDYAIDGQNHMGYETLNLNCGYDDPSSIREVLFNYLGRHYTPALKSNFVKLKINGQNWGPYANVQQLNGEYLREWFMSSEGTRWRAISPNFSPGGGPGGGGPGGGPGGGGAFGEGVSTLNYNGPDISDYSDNYTLKKTSKTNPWEDLIEACDRLNNLPLNQLADSLKYYLDVDKALWFLAHEIVFTDEDSYAWKGGMDYYVYWEPETDRIVPLEYDGNSCLMPNAYNWSPFYNENDVDYPLMNRLFAVPEFRQRYLAHVRTILKEYMIPVDVEARINFYTGMIGSLVQSDPKKIYSYSQFVNEVQEVKDFITDRRNYLLNHTEIDVQPLHIQSVSHPGNPASGSPVTITAEISGASGVSQINLYYAPDFVGVFEKTEMFDDGAHNDGAAGDGFFGTAIPGGTAGSYMRYYVEAVANDAAKTISYEPAGAEHDVYIYRVAMGTAVSDIVINEIMASNDSAVADNTGEYDDWIELYNKGTASVDISGYFLTDKADNLDKWEIPPGTVLAADEYLIIWADEDSSQGIFHANFKLAASGEELFLLDTDTLVIDSLSWTQQQTDMGYARVPNGTGNFVIQSPTFAANNGTTPLEDQPEPSMAMQVFPNPAEHTVYLQIPDYRTGEEIRIFNTFAQQICRQTGSMEVEINVSSWPAGMYFVQYQNQVKRLLIRH